LRAGRKDIDIGNASNILRYLFILIFLSFLFDYGIEYQRKNNTMLHATQSNVSIDLNGFFFRD